MAGGKRFPALFFRTAAGNEPVREWFQGLPVADRRILGRDLLTLELGWPVGMPLARSLGGGLWELRSNLSGGRTARVVFFVVQGQPVLVHAFIKKTQKTPKEDLELARGRKREWEKAHGESKGRTR
jgi:phage-related protein